VRRHRTQARRNLAILVVSAAALVGGLIASAPVNADPAPTLAQVQKRVDELHAQAEEANDRYNAATESLLDVQRRVERAQNEVARQGERVKQLSASLGGFAAMSYRVGGIDPTIQTLLADDPKEFLASASTMEAFAGQQTAQLGVVTKARQAFAESQALADDELAREKVVQSTIAAEKATVDRLVKEQEQLLAKLTAEEKARLAAEKERQRAAAIAARDKQRAALAAAPKPATANVPVSGRAGVAVAAAMSKLGAPYVYGGKGPDVFDCSGFTSWAWAQAGVSLSSSSRVQAGEGTPVSSSNLQPGDILYYGYPVSHVAMYIGNGQVIHASNPRTDVTIAPAMQAGGSAKPFRGAMRPG